MIPTPTTTRRRFLRGAAMSAAAASVLALPEGNLRAAPTVARRPQIRLGVSSYSFRKFDRAHVIEFMKELKTPWLNAKDVNDHLPILPAGATADAVAAYRAAGIEPTAVGVIPFPTKDSADIDQKFQYCTRAGVSLLVGTPTRETLPDVENFVKQYDIRLAIHNQGPDGADWPTPMDILKVISPMDHRIGLCIDVAHTVKTGTDVLGAIRMGGSRVFNIHMTDMSELSKVGTEVAVGDGQVPVRAIFEALHTLDYKGCVDLEYEAHEDDPMPGMIKSFAYMRGLLAGMGYEG